MREAFILFTRSTLSLIGSILTTVSFVVFVSLFAIESFGHMGGPYMGIMAFLIVPAIFVVGLILIPVGIWRQRVKQRKRMAAGEAPTSAPVLDFNQPRTRNIAFAVVVLTTINFVLIATGTYKGVEVMDSTDFCGGACHSVMSPESVAYSRSPHARVGCTECHIGPGANWFVKSKLSGAWQVVAVAFDLFPRPIPTPIENLRPARETCEQCHWPTKFVGERLRIRNHFAPDEAQTETKTVLLLNVGGMTNDTSKGIHWHVDPRNQIRYRADKTRQHVSEIELTLGSGEKKEYKRVGTMAGTPGAEPGWRTMDCVDCHNRPTHIYRKPEDEIDTSLYEKRLDSTLPFIKREGLRIIQADYASHDAAKGGIRNALFEYYQKNHAELAKDEPQRLEAAATELWNVYRLNVFPEMKIRWGTYPSFLGHDGCFRCHDSDLKAADNKSISKSCSLCHEVLATAEAEPEILEILHP